MNKTDIFANKKVVRTRKLIFKSERVRLFTMVDASFIILLQVLCASSEDHTLVEPLLVPEGAKPGECVSFSGYAELHVYISTFLNSWNKILLFIL